MFEKLAFNTYFFTNQNLYQFISNNDYIIPVTYLIKYPELANIADIDLPQLVGKSEKIFEYNIPKNVLKFLKHFPTNITGITLENAIYALLGAKKQNNSEFLAKNKLKVKYIGTLDSSFQTIPVAINDNGLLFSLEKTNDSYVEKINEVTKLFMSKLKPLINFIKNNIFINEEIMSQELNISPDNKVMAISDLSSSKSVMEIKTTKKVFDINGCLLDDIALQLFYQIKERKAYVLSITFGTLTNEKEQTVNSIKIIISKILFEKNDSQTEFQYKIDNMEKKVIKAIIENPYITLNAISRKLNLPITTLRTHIKRLKFLGYISKINRKMNTPWVVNRSIEDDTTLYKMKNIIYMRS